MDALRKAEQRQGEVPGVAPPGQASVRKLGLEPLPDRAAAPGPAVGSTAPQDDVHRRLPELPQRMEELDEQFFASDPAWQKSIRALAETRTRETRPDPPPGKVAASPSREAAQNVFAAKQPAPATGQGFAMAIGIATLIAVTAIGAYFYWQLQPRGGLAAGPAMSAMPAQPAASYREAPAPVAPQAAIAPAPANDPPATPRQPTDAAYPVIPPDRPVTRAAGSGTPRQAAVARPPQAAQAQSAGQPDTAIRLSSRPTKPDETMEAAHAAFTRGETDLARAIWLKTLQSDARNVNALHGLAALALREGKPEQAGALYRRVLEVDPKDAVAFAGLMSLHPPVDTRQAESQLKNLLAEQPHSPHLHFALGNLYLGDSRWAEAQQAFFKAHVADPANPDILYNLAVSLDHLHQSGPAAQYYARALVAAKAQAAAFDPARVEERLRMLRNERQR